MHHPIQDPETIRKAKEQDWWLTFDDVNPHARDILEKYSGIAPADVVQHVRDIRDRAIEIFVYPCIGTLKFLDIEIDRTPCYDEIKQRIARAPQARH
ncbi:hypothetical protein NQ176_g11374 [Zarea fungicola]|uniref:Uncharacterized protein n=1 Tax=Zarea fungicola TaxID=93591 RepID=A0ACC1MCI7_9HYPO|nr:hypothetical protein NQ176_g11374 [Lecanicillium fungicola]